MTLDFGLDLQRCEQLVTVMLHLLWEVTLLALIGGLAAKWCCGRSAVARYTTLYVALLLAVAAIPINWFILYGSPDDTPVLAANTEVPVGPETLLVTARADESFSASMDMESTVQQVAASVVNTEPAMTSGTGWESLPWSRYIVAGYFLGIAAMLLRLCWALSYGRGLRRSSQRIAAPEVNRMVQACSRKLGLQIPPLVATCARVTSPVVVGMLKPAVLLPPALLGELNLVQIEAILLHELAHIVRRDHWLNAVQRGIETILFFHPAIWWLSHQIQKERDLCCDDLASRNCGDPCDYAESLIVVSEWRNGQSAASAAGLACLSAVSGSSTQLRVRVSRVLGISQDTLHLDMTRRGLLLSVGMILAIAATMVSATIIDADDSPAVDKGLPPANETASVNESAGTTEMVAVAPDPAEEPIAEAPELAIVRVIDGETDKPIRDASFVHNSRFNHREMYQMYNIEALTAVAKTNDRGEVEVPIAAIDYLQFRVLHPNYLRSAYAPVYYVFGAGSAAKMPWPYGKQDGVRVIRLWPAETLTGTLLDVQGKPAGNLLLTIRGEVEDTNWIKQTADFSPAPTQFGKVWQTHFRTDAQGKFSVGIPPAKLRKNFRLLQHTKTAAPLLVRVTGPQVKATLPSPITVRGKALTADGKPVVGATVSLDPVLHRVDGTDLAQLGRSAVTDNKGRFQLPVVGPGQHILRGAKFLPQRLRLDGSQETVKVTLRGSEFQLVEFDFENRIGHNSGNYNFSIRGDLPLEGNSTTAHVVVPVAHGKKVLFQVPKQLRNARLHTYNFLHQVVHIVDEDGEQIVPGTDPIKLSDLNSPPRLKLVVDPGARLWVKVAGIDQASVEVRGVANGDLGTRDLGAFHRVGENWESPGLYPQERVTIQVKHAGGTVQSVPTAPVKPGQINQLEVKFEAPKIRVANDTVDKSVAWLKSQQSETGMWSMQGPYKHGAQTENELAATSLAVLALIAAGEGESDAVRKGLTALAKSQQPDGRFKHRTSNHQFMYTHALATMALCRGVQVGHIQLRDVATRALTFCEESQSPQGGWRYQPKSNGDTSVTAWFVQALELGQQTKLYNGKATDLTRTYLASVKSNEGYSYTPGGRPTASMTAAGLYSHLLIDKPKNTDGFDGSVKLVEKALAKASDKDCYTWYYVTKMLKSLGGKEWSAWRARILKQLGESQVAEGDLAGSWEARGDKWGTHGGRLLVTTLSLQVYLSAEGK